MARWAAQAASRRTWAAEGEALRAWDAFLAETPYGRKLAGTWARRIDGLREDREMVTAARRARRERREAEAAAAVAREEMRAAERDALIAQKRLEAAEAKRREALHRADRATVTLAPAAPARPAVPPAPPLPRARPVQEPVQQRDEPRRDNSAAAMGGSRRHCYYCGRLGVSTDWKCPNAAQHNKARPWFHHRD